jgi:hypothetical protein
VPIQLSTYVGTLAKYIPSSRFPRRTRPWRDQRSKKKPIARGYAAAAAGGAAALLAVLALVVYHQRLREYILDTFFGPAPPAACLRDPAAAASYVRWRALPTDDELVYHCVRAAPAAPPGPLLRAYQRLPPACRDAFFEAGAACHDGSRTVLDLAWTWVNGSDALLHDAMAAAVAEEDAVHNNGQKLYRSVSIFLRTTACPVTSRDH